MADQRSGRVVNGIACGALVVVIVGLLVATWMPAIVAARQKRVAATSQPAPSSQPASTTATTQPTPAPAE
jgi:hypothetical protein